MRTACAGGLLGKADGVDDLFEPIRAAGVGRDLVKVAGVGEPQLARGALRVVRRIERRVVASRLRSICRLRTL